MVQPRPVDFVSLPNDTKMRESIGKIIGLAKCAIPHPTEMETKLVLPQSLGLTAARMSQETGTTGRYV